MREKWMRFISLFLVGILCCSIFAGCSSNVSEEDIQGPEAISQGKVAQESVSIVQGENHFGGYCQSFRCSCHRLRLGNM